ncbi:M4 family metallopeptidase [Tellurirhabdus bombi]|uniref:M4 family metallopeptidase n=1 Tax=Tellurirhabdus bombi TaxID=2907205 RepID=UPI001F2BAFFD|nr:M4 family metallopeptidase [Tellurirhabdus bombi]
MKPLLCTLLLGCTLGAVAQQPRASFESKKKTLAPSTGLAQRLKAEEVAVPTQERSDMSFFKGATSLANPQPLRLRIVRDKATQLPVYIENKSPIRPVDKGARLSVNASVFQFLGQIKGVLKMDNPDEQLKITRTETDALGQTHVRMAQVYQGIPVHGSELIAHLNNGVVTLLNGQFRTPKSVPTKARLTMKEAADRALQDIGRDYVVQPFGKNIFGLKTTEGDLCLYSVGDKMVLAYRLTVRPTMAERWEYKIDAQTGAILDKHNSTCVLNRVIASEATLNETNVDVAALDGAAKSSGKDLNGVSRSVNTYEESGTYYMIDLSRPMFDPAASEKAGELVGAIQTLDAENTKYTALKIKEITSKTNKDWKPEAVSAHYNMTLAYEYYEKTHKRNSLDGKGGSIYSLVNVADKNGKSWSNATWNGKFMSYGNGGDDYKPLAGSLDVAGHEMTHGVVQHTANLEYQGQSGAMNESMADVFGVMIDRDDWLLGDDVVKTAHFPSGALRSMSNPNQGGTKDRGYQPKTMAQYITTEEDNGGVHYNSGIPNYAFYLFATNASVGKDKAEKVYYRALTTYLTPKSQFVDLRLAVIRSTSDLFGEKSNEVKAAKEAFDAVGILENTKPQEPTKDLPANDGQDMILVYSTGDQKLYSVPFNTDKFEPKVGVALKHRPSITDDGKFAFYVLPDGRIRRVSLTGSPQVEVVSEETIWDNVAISRDGKKLAALTKEKDKSIWVYSYDLRTWKKFTLFNPTSTEGVTIGEVQYADSFEWDPSGEFIIYDAYNTVDGADGAAIDYWDVGVVRVWDAAKQTFGNGQIGKLFTGFEKGEGIGNPSFSKNSPNIIAFDYTHEIDKRDYVFSYDRSKGTFSIIYENNTLGFPSYSKMDNMLLFNTLSTEDKELVAVIGLEADKLTPKTNPEALYSDAKWGVFYAAGNRTQQTPAKTAQTITFNPIDNKRMGDQPFRLIATASSKLAVTFAVVSGPAKVSGNQLTITGAGEVSIRASQAGNEQYAAATPVVQTFTVTAITALEPTWVDAVKLYPNPVKTTLTVEVPTNEPLEGVTLLTSSGQPAIQQNLSSPSSQTILDTSQLTPGLYILTIRTQKGTISRKIVKQ